jgi:hypothetical protein
MVNVFTEFGIGNSSFVSTEFEFDGGEVRVNGFYGISDFTDPYIRIWLGKRVVVISKYGVRVVRKSYNAFKLIFGFAGGEI